MNDFRPKCDICGCTYTLFECECCGKIICWQHITHAYDKENYGECVDLCEDCLDNNPSRFMYSLPELYNHIESIVKKLRNKEMLNDEEAKLLADYLDELY